MIDTRNDYFVGVLGDDIVITLPTGRMTKPQAIRLAAWIVALADYGNENTFDEVRQAVANT